MSARSIAHALGLRRAGNEYTGACPCCSYKTGFNITERDGRLLISCLAGGCEQRDLWATLRKLGLVPERDAPEAETPAETRRSLANNGFTKGG